VAHGTTNPWGLDFDDYGEAFITNCVIHHLWHVVPGHYEHVRQDINRTPTASSRAADHIHWAGVTDSSRQTGRSQRHRRRSRTMIYLGDNWPAHRSGAFTCNIHGNRVNHDTLERRGSGYVARHAKDFLMANDPWFWSGRAVWPDGGAA
jgi:hypothetical protein